MGDAHKDRLFSFCSLGSPTHTLRTRALRLVRSTDHRTVAEETPQLFSATQNPPSLRPTDSPPSGEGSLPPPGYYRARLLPPERSWFDPMEHLLPSRPRERGPHAWRKRK